MISDNIKKDNLIKSSNLDYSEVIKRIIKYSLEGLAVAVAARYIPKENIEVQEIIMIAITSACVFAILDMYAPSVSGQVRRGLRSSNIEEIPVAS